MDLLATGVLGAPHGLQGYMKLRTFSSEWEHLIGIGEVLLRKDGNEHRVVLKHVIASGKDLLVLFKGVDTPEAAKIYTGWEVWIPRSQAPTLSDGEWYVADLIACKLVFDGTVVGIVVNTIDGPQSLLLEVESSLNAKRYLVPFMEQFIGTVDIHGRNLELKAPWLLS